YSFHNSDVPLRTRVGLGDGPYNRRLADCPTGGKPGVIIPGIRITPVVGDADLIGYIPGTVAIPITVIAVGRPEFIDRRNDFLHAVWNNNPVANTDPFDFGVVKGNDFARLGTVSFGQFFGCVTYSGDID